MGFSGADAGPCGRRIRQWSRRTIAPESTPDVPASVAWAAFQTTSGNRP